MAPYSQCRGRGRRGVRARAERRVCGRAGGGGLGLHAGDGSGGAPQRVQRLPRLLGQLG